MPINKIEEHYGKIKNTYFAQMDLRDAIESARAILERLNNGNYQGLISESTSGNTVDNEKESKEGENKETEDARRQKLLLNGFFAITPGLTPDNKLKHGGKLDKN